MKTGIARALLFLPLAVALAQHTTNFRRPSNPLPAVKGMPYSGELAREIWESFDDGARIIDTPAVRKEYRDSQGRTRVEQPLFEYGTVKGDQIIVVTIDDPVASFEYVLDPKRKITHRFKLEQPALSQPRLSLGPPEVPEVSAFLTKTETLPPRVIRGVRAEGARQTFSFPDSSRGGNQGPRVAMTETWTASDLQIVIEEESRTRTNGSNAKLTNLRREEQPARLFQIPPDYRIEDELRDFNISSPISIGVPRAISAVRAKYTEEAREKRIKGTVRLSVTVDKNGKTRDIRVEQPVEPGLDQAAITAVSLWRFRPAMEGDRAVNFTLHVEIPFGLN